MPSEVPDVISTRSGRDRDAARCVFRGDRFAGFGNARRTGT